LKIKEVMLNKLLSPKSFLEILHSLSFGFRPSNDWPSADPVLKPRTLSRVDQERKGTGVKEKLTCY